MGLVNPGQTDSGVPDHPHWRITEILNANLILCYVLSTAKNTINKKQIETYEIVKVDIGFHQRLLHLCCVLEVYIIIKHTMDQGVRYLVEVLQIVPSDDGCFLLLRGKNMNFMCPFSSSMVRIPCIYGLSMVSLQVISYGLNSLLSRNT